MAKIYDILTKNSEFTIDGYQFLIKYELPSSNTTQMIKLYTTKKEYFTNAITSVIKSYVGSDRYEAYINNSQVSIATIGSVINNVYLEDKITVKNMHISVSNQIYISSDTIASFLLYGNNPSNISYTVKDGETISELAYNNKVSINDFLLANPKLSGSNTLLYKGQIVNLGIPNPQIHVVMEEFVIKDQEEKYTINEVFDPTVNSGSKTVTQKGENGIIRVSENIKTVNGVINYVSTVSKQEIKPVVNQVVRVGTKIIPNIGTGNWIWPTTGYTISSEYGWRIDPFTGKPALHDGMDVTGAYGAPVFAVDNGIVYSVGSKANDKYYFVNGNTVIINHQNGYYTYYGHLNKPSTFLTVGQTVSKGDVIGYIGTTGAATGPHVHFGAFRGIPYHGGQSFNPRVLYR